MLHFDCQKLDPRIRRTRGLLQDALKRLLEEKEFDKISIQDIAQAATLNRATFYLAGGIFLTMAPFIIYIIRDASMAMRLVSTT